MLKTLRILAIACVAVLSTAIVSEAASWNQVRDRVMTLRESGKAGEAYALAMSAAPTSASDRSDRDFVAGFLAWRHLASPESAIRHFRSMIDHSANIQRQAEQRDTKAKAGYWLGELLASNGKSDDANRFFQAAAGYRNTFYGMLSATKIGLQDSPSIIRPLSASYPAPALYWHDPRIRRELVLAVIKAESGFRPTAQSHAGAKGLMQLMDGTAKDVGRRAGIAIDLAMVARDGNYNIAIGSKHLADLMVKYDGNMILAAAAYNAGERRVEEWLARFGDPRRNVSSVDWAEMIPFKETRDYVQKVGGYYFTYLALGQ